MGIGNTKHNQTTYLFPRCCVDAVARSAISVVVVDAIVSAGRRSEDIFVGCVRDMRCTMTVQKVWFDDLLTLCIGRTQGIVSLFSFSFYRATDNQNQNRDIGFTIRFLWSASISYSKKREEAALKKRRDMCGFSSFLSPPHFGEKI